MKRLALFVLVALVAAAPSYAQLFEGVTNLNVVAGATYRLENPGVEVNRVSFMLSANVAGIKVGTLPLYLGGIGLDLRTLDPAFAQFGNALSMTVPGVTYYFKGDKVCAQVGYSYALSDAAEARNGIYAAVGIGWSSPNYLAYKRAAKKAKAAGKPLPPNPYDVK